MPVGTQKLGGVTYVLGDFRTSPVPSVFMLKGTGSRTNEEAITGIRVGRTCDALFLLHAFNASNGMLNWRPRERSETTPPTVFQYVVHYADGTTIVVPVVWQRGVGHWVNAAPAALLAVTAAETRK